MMDASSRLRPAVALALVWPLAACVAETKPQSSAQSPAQPRIATYDCGQDATVTVETLGSSVRVVGPDGETVDLPASPANQQSRFGEPPYAIVLEGREALFMKNGRLPLTCLR